MSHTETKNGVRRVELDCEALTIAVVKSSSLVPRLRGFTSQLGSADWLAELEIDADDWREETSSKNKIADKPKLLAM